MAAPIAKPHYPPLSMWDIDPYDGQEIIVESNGDCFKATFSMGYLARYIRIGRDEYPLSQFKHWWPYDFECYTDNLTAVVKQQGGIINEMARLINDLTYKMDVLTTKS